MLSGIQRKYILYRFHFVIATLYNVATWYFCIRITVLWLRSDLVGKNCKANNAASLLPGNGPSALKCLRKCMCMEVCVSVCLCEYDSVCACECVSVCVCPFKCLRASQGQSEVVAKVGPWPPLVTLRIPHNKGKCLIFFYFFAFIACVCGNVLYGCECR